MFGGCLEGVGIVSGGYLDGVWRESRGFLEVVWRVSGWVWKVFMGFPNGL